MDSKMFLKQTKIQVSSDQLYHWHELPGAFHRLCPPWQSIKVDRASDGLKEGEEVHLRLCKGPFCQKWIARLKDCHPGEGFTDVQERGPFKKWIHRHRFLKKDQGCVLEDEIEYEVPGGTLGRLFLGSKVRSELEGTFFYRHQVTKNDLECMQEFSQQKPLRILVSGASGLVGSRLCLFLENAGHKILRLVRRPSSLEEEIYWNDQTGDIEREKLDGKIDGVIHLAGENIAARRWSKEQKKRIADSRVKGTQGLVHALNQCEQKPSFFLCASAVGFYGNRGEDLLTEESAPSDDFLSRVCQDWEAAAQSLEGVRVACLRFGMILSPQGGALGQMLTPFKMGVGGILGSGKQQMSWIHIDDLIYHCYRVMMNETLQGAINFVSPHPVSNHVFTKTLGKILGRPTIMPLPGFVARVAFGEMADALLLSSQKVYPQKLKDTGCRFAYPHLEDALRHLLGKPMGNQ